MDSPVYGGSLIDALRRVIKDTGWVYPQFEFSVTGATTAILEVTDGHFLVTASGGGVPSSDLLLKQDTTATIELLVATLSAKLGYVATLIEDGNPNHASTDLMVLGPTSCLNTTIILKTRRWSDDELATVLQMAIDRHTLSADPDEFINWNPPYTIATVPASHQYVILLLAQIELLKMQVLDATRRRGTDLTPEQFMGLKQSFEAEYDSLLARSKQRQPKYTEENTRDLGTGDGIQGSFVRRRPGDIYSSHTQAPQPPASYLSAKVLGSGKVFLEWTPCYDASFYRYELWRHTTDEVSCFFKYVQPAGSLPETGEKVRMEFNPRKTNWVDGATAALTPGTYYYRVYVFNKNELYTGSDPVLAVEVT